MATAAIPLSNQGHTYTIITQVIPSSTVPTTVQQPLPQQSSSLSKFLKGEPKALGTVQIMMGMVMIMLGIVLAMNPFSISTYSGIAFWGALLHISSGSVAVSGSNKLHACVVKSALGLNVINTIAAGIAVIMFSLDIVIMSCEHDDYRNGRVNTLSKGISGILLVLSTFQFGISIALSAFSCKAVCTNEPTLNIIKVVPIQDQSAHQPQPVSHLNTIDMDGPSLDRPPAYSEKSLPDY